MSNKFSKSKPSGLPIIHQFAAGIDIGSRFHVAAISPDLCDEPVLEHEIGRKTILIVPDLFVKSLCRHAV